MIKLRSQLSTQARRRDMINFLKPIVDIAIVCSDFETSLHFYRDLLELEVILDINIPVETAVRAALAPRKFRQVRLAAGKTLIKLMEIDSPPDEGPSDFQAGIRWLTFVIHDVPGTKAALEAKGVEFLSAPISAPDARYIVCAKAPDGVLLEFVQVE